jgi:hypothetical protein
MIELLEHLLEQDEEDFEDLLEPVSDEDAKERGYEKLKIEIKPIDFRAFRQLVEDKEGIVVLGAGEPHSEWAQGIVSMWQHEGTFKGTVNEAFSEIYLLETTGGRHDLAMVFNSITDLSMGKMAMWRLRFGDCSWISDYIVNYASQHR